VAGRPGPCDVVRGLPWFSAIMPIPKKPGLPGLLSTARPLRAHAPDVAVVFPHSFRTALLAYAAGARRRVGYDRNGRGLLLTDRVAPYRVEGRIQPVYMAKEYLDLVAHLGCEDDGAGPELLADTALTAQVNRRLGNNRPRVGFAPGGAFGPSKRWPPERFAQVADALRDRTGAQCVLLTGPGEQAIRDAVQTHASEPLAACETGEPTIAGLKATVSQLDLLVCNDSGPRHVAVAFGVPTLCIMGPTSPRYSEGPYEQGRVLRVDVDCGPCQKPVCDTDHRCMTRIEPETVAETALEVLASGPTHP